MREIKFRAWDKRDHKIIQVSALSLDPQNGWSNGVCGLHIGLAETDYNLMQYTGLKDKNGVEIYGGDLITPAGLPPTDFSIKLVEFNSGWYGYKTIVGEWNILADTAHEGRMSVWEVIGNMYENPELVSPEVKE